MLFSKIDILDSDLNLQSDMYVGVKDGIIKYIGREKPLEDFGESYNGRGKLLMSGFINAHSHSAMTLMRGYAENMTLSDWLYKRIFPFEAKLYGEAVYYGTMLAAAEMVRFGIVSTTDMYYFGEYVKRAVLDSGIKMNYDFDKVIDRSGTGSYKWKNGDAMLPMWVADMSFPVAPPKRRSRPGACG